MSLIVIGFSITSVNLSDPARAGGDTGVEHWNYKSTSIAPENPTSNDLITFKLEVNSDSNVSKVDIYICKDNVCGLPLEMMSTQANVYSIRHTEKFADGAKVNYRFTIKYTDSEKIEYLPTSVSTKDVSLVLGSLYFEFFIGENWNYKSTSVDPAKPTPEDDVTFTFGVDDDSQIKSISIFLAWDKPEFTESTEQLMEKSSENTYTFKTTQKFEVGTKVGYRFIIEYDQDIMEPVPTSGSTANVFEEQEELYFGVTIGGIPDVTDGVDGDDSDKDEGGFLPGFEASTTVIAFMFIIVILLGLSSVLRYENRKRR
jgi:hypothetical protein